MEVSARKVEEWNWLPYLCHTEAQRRSLADTELRKKEFSEFDGLLDKAHKNIQTGLNQLDDVVGARTRAIQRTGDVGGGVEEAVEGSGDVGGGGGG